MTYAPLAPFAAKSRRPRALLLIIAGHAALLAAVMTAKMDLPVRFVPTVTTVDLIETPKPPLEKPPPLPPAPPLPNAVDQSQVVLPIANPPQPLADLMPLPPPDPGSAIGSGAAPAADPPLAGEPVRTGPRFITPPSELRPPYPEDKLLMEQEAVLRLRLSIDSAGRVTAVEPVGRADRSFLAAARRHIIAHWRYKPATEDSHAVASSTVITLRFELDR